MTEGVVDLYLVPKSWGIVNIVVMKFKDPANAFLYKISFSSNRTWAQKVALRFIYKYGKVKEARHENGRYPPILRFEFPESKLGLILATKHIKYKHKSKIEKLINEGKEDELEREIITIGISEVLNE